MSDPGKVRRAQTLANAELAVRDDPVRRLIESAQAEASRRAWRALTVATDIETACALLRGERVPADRCDPKWLAKFGWEIERS